MHSNCSIFFLSCSPYPLHCIRNSFPPPFRKPGQFFQQGLARLSGYFVDSTLESHGGGDQLIIYFSLLVQGNVDGSRVAGAPAHMGCLSL